ncbi:SCO family protein [Solirubrobacter ginsenosidimutans]|uniref:SCO family protein n=1 Tax=Solirubrobacter ginsenosidimutans TaxID=490573 RepID=A0A9X3N0P4_9ACTN|nr:SCO family protein [Solirubrobacter ginsenosidimutans]MDA0165161.1 SCO family protein [Solirubrobacter ginsenosidimutans]
MLPARLQLALIALTLCAVAAVAGVLLAQRTHLENTSSLQLTNGWAGAQRPDHQPVPAFTLRDQDGKTVTSASLRGKPVVFAFIYSTCRDTCPAQVQTIRGALDDFPGSADKVRVIGISVDPANDTPKRAQSFLLKQQMTGRMQFLLGSRAQLKPVWDAFAIQPQSKALEHSAHTVLADADGVQRVGFPFDHLTGEGLVHDLERLAP